MEQDNVTELIEKISLLIKEHEQVIKVTLETSKGTKINITNQDYKLYGN